MTDYKLKYKRRKYEIQNKTIRYLDPERLQLFTNKDFSFNKCLKLTAEAHGSFRTASLLVRWTPNDEYFVDSAAVAQCYKSQSFAERDYWVSSKQLKNLQDSADQVVLMLWELFRGPKSPDVRVKISHVPTHRLIRDWSTQSANKLPGFKMQNSCEKLVTQFLG